VKRFFQIAPVVAVSLAVSLAAGKADVCPEGMTATGECVDPGLAVAERLSAVILSQPALSYTAFPVLPAGDLDFRYPHQLIPNQQTLPPNSGVIRRRR